MKFTDQYHNEVTKQDLKEFNSREIIYNSTGASNLGTENAVLTLENEVVFYDGVKAFFKRLNNSDKIKNYSEERKQTLFFKWLSNFLTENQKKVKTVQYIYEKTLLNELKEASIILFNQYSTEEE